MSNEMRTVRVLQDWFDSEAPERPPSELLDQIASATRSVRPRPSWIARLEGHHMDVIEGGRRAGSPRMAVALVILALLIVAVGTLVFIGSSRQPPVVVTPSGPPAAVVSASPSASVGSPMRSIQPGDPIPDELIGTWSAYEFGEYAYYRRAGDPYCVDHWKTTQDCLTWYGNNEFYRNGNIVTLVDGKLRFWPIGDDRCKGTANLVEYERVGDEIHLTVLPDQCFTDMSNLRPAGPGSAPTLPPY